MRAFYSDHFVLPLPVGHRFPMQKYRLLREALAPLDGLTLCEAAPAADGELALAHAPSYVSAVVNGLLDAAAQREIGFPWSPAMVERSLRSTGATISACRAALADGLAVNLAGGTHHAFADRAEGYCVFNDSAVAARVMQAEGRVRQVVIIDCDVHQGNGTAAILAGDPSVFTLSVHAARNFPFTKQRSDLDIDLPDGTGDAAYLAALTEALAYALERSRAELAVYLAGADPFVGDRLGRLALSKDGLSRRDELVLATCRDAGLPVAVTMAGGYARELDDIVDIHYRTVEIAAAMARAGVVQASSSRP